MKRFGSLWDRLITWDNLLLAARKARRAKRSRQPVLRFEFRREYELLELARDLERGQYQPGGFHTHWIQEPKPRLISAAPYRDRVVHHALMNVLEPVLERHFRPHSYACRRGKGTHAAADRVQVLMRRHRFAVHADVRKFFPSIDHCLLKALFRRLIKDDRVLTLMDLVVESANAQEPVLEWFDGDDLFTPVQRRRGLPIGNLTSQWFANWYLTPLDHFVTSRLGVGSYVRYCDDLVLLHDDRVALRGVVAQVADFLADWRLRLHEGKRAVAPVERGLTFVGYRVWPTHRLVRKPNIRRFRRRVAAMQRAYAQGRMSWPDVRVRLASWLGHARQADSRRLIRQLSREWRFVRRNVGCADQGALPLGTPGKGKG